MIRALIALLFIALAGAIAFLALKSGGASPQDTSVATGGAEAQVAAASSGDEANLTAPDVEGPGEERDRAEALVAPEPGAGSMAASADEAEAAPDAVLTGRVTDANGAPLPGASVRVRPRGLNRILEFEGASLAAAKWPTVSTRADGRFELTCQPGDARLEIGLDGFAPFTKKATAKSNTEVDLGDLRLAQGVTLRGRVVDESGVGIEGAPFRAEPEADGGITIVAGNEPPVAVSGPGGEFEIARQAAGAYRFFVEHENYPAAELAGQLEMPGEVSSDLLVTLRAGALIRGTALGLPQDAESSSGAKFNVFAAPAQADGFFFADFSGPRRHRSVAVAADGSFEIGGLENGVPYTAYLIDATGSRFRRKRRSLSVESVAAVGGGTPIQLAYSDGASVSFTVVDEGGVPLVPEEIRAGFDYPEERDDADIDESTGRCTISGLWPEGESSNLMLQVSSKGLTEFERNDIKVFPGEYVDIGRVVLSPRPTIRVTVLDSVSGEPIKGATVELSKYEEPSNVRRMSVSVSTESDAVSVFEGDGSKSGTTDADGVCVLDATAGAKVMLSVDDGLHAPQEVGPLVVPEGAGVHEEEVRLEPGGAIRITALDPSGRPAAKYPVQFKGESSMGQMGRGESTGPDGTMELTGLPPGPHFLRLGKRAQSGPLFMPRIRMEGLEEDEEDDNDWVKVEVLAGETVEVALEAPAIGALSGVILERGQPLDGATVKLESEGADNALAGIMGLMGGGPSVVTDARGEFRIEDLEAGDYKLVIEHASRAMPASQPQEIEGGDQEVEVDLSVTEVTGTITNETGEPVVGARVEVERVQEEGSGGVQVASVMMFSSDSGGEAGMMMSIGGETVEAAYSDGEGRYRLRGVQHGANLVVKATFSELGEAKSEPFSVSEGGEESGVDLEFQIPGSIKIVAEGLKGQLIVIVRRLDGGAGAAPQTRMLTEEETVMDSLAPGRWSVSLNSMGAGDVAIEPASIEVTVEAGETAEAVFRVE